jgi:predicted GH43/DUF377 family glycosyl hydrolase
MIETAALAGIELAPVERLGDRPILDAGTLEGYGPLFNAGLVHHDGRYHLFVRAVRDGYGKGDPNGPRFIDYVSDIVVFDSDDGHSYEYGYVLAEAGLAGALCFEDPRVQKVPFRGETNLVMTYTHLPPPGEGPWRIGAHRLHWDGKRFALDHQSAQLLGPANIENKDAVIFTLNDGKVALIQRISPNMQLAVFEDLDHLWQAGSDYWDDYLADLDAHVILRPSAGALGIGAGAPPVRVETGFLLFYHERRSDGSYTMNVALLDPDTGKVSSKLLNPILEPELEWEREGDVNNVIFVQGAHREGDRVYLTYGAADSHVGAAMASVPRLLAMLREEAVS